MKQEYTAPEVELIVFDRWIDTLVDSDPNWDDPSFPPNP